MKKSEPSSNLQTDAHRIERRDGEFSHKDIFITANSIFGHSVQMQLRRNDDLLAPSFKVSRIDDDDLETELKDRSYPLCYYLGSNGTISAAVSACEFSAKKGLVSIKLFIKDLILLKKSCNQLSLEQNPTERKIYYNEIFSRSCHNLYPRDVKEPTSTVENDLNLIKDVLCFTENTR